MLEYLSAFYIQTICLGVEENQLVCNSDGTDFNDFSCAHLDSNHYRNMDQNMTLVWRVYIITGEISTNPHTRTHTFGNWGSWNYMECIFPPNSQPGIFPTAASAAVRG